MVSVIIPTYNRAEMLRKCVISVCQNTYKDIEVLIVDNASTDNTQEVIRRCIDNDNRIHYTKLEVNMMAAGGRNAGIRIARGEFLLFLDNDNIVEKNMIEELVIAFSKKKEAGMIGALSLNGDSIWSLGSFYNFWTLRSINFMGEKPFYKDEITKEYYQTCLCQNNMMVKRECIRKIGGFDRQYYAMYEEADFGYRLCKAGYKSFFYPKAITHHMGYRADNENSCLRKYGLESTKRAFCFARNRSVFMKKFAPWYCKIFFFLVMIHAFTVFYCMLALKEGRIDIAISWVKGTLSGMFSRVKNNIYVDI